MHVPIMNRDTRESKIRWLGRRPMRKGGMNGITIEDLEKKQPREADMVTF